MISNTVVLLLGFPGVGKLTIARALAPMIGATVVDNHWINNPIFGLIKLDGRSSLPHAVWERTAEIRVSVMETIATLSEPDANFIFTYYGIEGESYDQESYDLMARTAARRGATFVPIRLFCEVSEHARRMAMPDRALRLKQVDATAVKTFASQTLFNPAHPNQLTLDTTRQVPEENAVAILNWLQTLTTERGMMPPA